MSQTHEPVGTYHMRAIVWSLEPKYLLQPQMLRLVLKPCTSAGCWSLSEAGPSGTRVAEGTPLNRTARPQSLSLSHLTTEADFLCYTLAP